MPIEVLNPDDLPKPEVYRQMSVATGSRTVFVSGQVARNADGEPVRQGLRSCSRPSTWAFWP